MEKRVAVYNNNTGVVETMSSLLAGEGLKMVAVTGRAQLQELLRAQEIQLLLLKIGALRLDGLRRGGKLLEHELIGFRDLADHIHTVQKIGEAAGPEQN